MKAKNLKVQLEDLIITKLLKHTNCTQFYLESLKFQSAPIQKACENIMVQYFSDIAHDEKGL